MKAGAAIVLPVSCTLSFITEALPSVGFESSPVVQEDCRTAVGKGWAVCHESDDDKLRPKNDEKYVDVVRLNFGAGKEMIASGRKDVLRIVDDGPLCLVARLRVIMAGVSVVCVDEASLLSGDDEDSVELGLEVLALLRVGLGDRGRPLLGMMVVVTVGVGDCDKLLVGAALEGIVHLRGF